MALLTEFIDVIIPIANIEKCYQGGFAQYKIDTRKSKIIWFDDYIVRDGAMNPMDIEFIVQKWKKNGLQPTEIIDGAEYWKDICVLEGMFGGATFPCEWLINNKDGTVSHIQEIVDNSALDDINTTQLVGKIFCDKSLKHIDLRITPDNIAKLNENEVFVFGSNIYGNHAGGAARTARKKNGAISGQGEGLQGQSYAIPTMFNSVQEIQPYVQRFIEFAEQNPDKRFFVTKIGCGIAGFKVNEIAELFVDVIDKNIGNICLPKEFYFVGHTRRDFKPAKEHKNK